MIIQIWVNYPFRLANRASSVVSLSVSMCVDCDSPQSICCGNNNNNNVPVLWLNACSWNDKSESSWCRMKIVISASLFILFRLACGNKITILFTQCVQIKLPEYIESYERNSWNWENFYCNISARMFFLLFQIFIYLIILCTYFLGRSAKKGSMLDNFISYFQQKSPIKDYSVFSAENNINPTFLLSLWIQILPRSKLDSRFKTQ